MGIVYRALDPTIGRTVAIKAIRLTDFADPAERQRVRDRLLQEARSAGLLSHPNIITIFDVLEEEASAFIVMEYVQGPSLGDILRAGQLPESSQMVRYFGQIADALDYAHRKGVIHRDIKSANILISSEHDHAGLAKISDFGISKFISQDTTHSGTMIGTPNYMAPEQIQGLAVDGRSDQFSFAVVVYEMLTGTKPFRADSLATLFYQICKQDPPPAHEVNTTLSSQVDYVLARALAKDPAERFVSCTEFVAALGESLNYSGNWQPARNMEEETKTIASAAVAAGVSEPASFVRTPVEQDEYGEPMLTLTAPVIFPERPGAPELPALPRRTRPDRGQDDADQDASGPIRRLAESDLAGCCSERGRCRSCVLAGQSSLPVNPRLPSWQSQRRQTVKPSNARLEQPAAAILLSGVAQNRLQNTQTRNQYQPPLHRVRLLPRSFRSRFRSQRNQQERESSLTIVLRVPARRHAIPFCLPAVIP